MFLPIVVFARNFLFESNSTSPAYLFIAIDLLTWKTARQRCGHQWDLLLNIVKKGFLH